MCIVKGLQMYNNFSNYTTSSPFFFFLLCCSGEKSYLCRLKN